MKRLLPALLILASLGASAALKEKVYRYLPLKEDLSVIYPGGERNMNVSYSRNSEAVTPDFKTVPVNQPRFWKGGLLIEAGGKVPDRGTINLLPGKEDPFDKSGASVQAIAGMTKSAFSFSGKIVLKPVAFNIKKNFLSTTHIFSFYAKGSGKLKLTPVTVLQNGQKKNLPVQEFQLTGEWKRYFIKIDGGVVRTKKDLVDTFSATLEGKNVSFDAAMLETPCSYFGVNSPTTYVPNGAYRMPDQLKMPELPAEMGLEGAFAFNVTMMAHGGWQSLLTIGQGRWANDLEIDYTDAYGGFLRVTTFRGVKNSNAKMPMKIGRTFHVILSYDKESFSVYIDGKKAFTKQAKAVPFKKNSVFIGGRAIQVYSNMLYSNFTIFRKPLTDAEAAELAANPDLENQLSSAKIRPASPFTVFPVNSGIATVRFKSALNVTKVTAAIDGFSIVKSAVSNGNDIVCNFDPSKLMPGKYNLILNCELADGTTETVRSPLEVCNALRPKENLQINSWNENGPNHAKFGITMGSGGLDPLNMDNAARNGTYATYNLYYTGMPRPGYESEDRARNYKGEFTYPRPRSLHIQQDMIRQGQNIAAQIKDSPTFLGIVLNSESHQGSAGAPNGFDFSPAELAVAKSFGLDLSKWIPSGELTKKPWTYFYHPIGNLSILPAPELVPADRSIPEDNPLYAYHVERHGPTGGTDVVLNDLVAREILKVRPDVIVTQDPILRRPFLRSYREINNAADWCYYVELHTVVILSERLNAVTRGLPNMTATTMPQFLFKPGMVAPYSGLPSAHMFREASYLAVSRPTRVLTFWNIGAALRKGNQQTAEEILALTGSGDWNATAAVIKQKKLKLFCFDPELAPEIKRVSDTLWYPFGALFPKWKNAPRKIAIVRSFASDLFGNIHWSGSHHKELPTAVAQLGIPYDVLYDEDLSGDLSGYDMILVPAAFALPSNGVKNLLAYQKNGGVVVVDEKCKVTALSGAVQLRMSKISTREYEAKAKELFERAQGRINTPLYIEGMQALQEKKAAESRFPGLAELVQKHVSPAFSCNKNAVFWNHLQAEGADYLFAVNDLRIPGPIYGRFGKVRERGLPQEVEFSVKNPGFRYAYDLMASKQIPISGGKIRLNLDACSGRIVLFTEKKLGELSAECPASVPAGDNVTVEIQMKNGTGLIPVLLDVYDASGKKHSVSRSEVLKNGALDFTFTIPVNAPEGRWKVQIKELATGQIRTVSFTVNR